MSLKEKLSASINKDKDINAVDNGAMMKWPKATIVFVGMWFSMWAVTIGFTMGQCMAPAKAILACVIGFLCTGVYMALVGIIGCRKRLPTVTLLEKYGGKVISIVFALSTVIIYTWSVGMQADIAGQSLAAALGVEDPSWCSAALACIMVVSAIIGIAAITKLSTIVVPLFLAITIVVAIVAVGRYGGIAQVMSTEVASTMSFAAAVSSAASAWISFATMAPDVTRHINKPKDVAIASVLSMVIGVVLPVVGVFLAITTGVSDMGQTFAALGLPWLGVVAIFFAAWTTNDNNNYCGGIALAKLTKMSRTKATLIVAAVGIVLAWLGSGASNVIGASLGWISSCAGPVGGLLIAYYFILANNGKNEVHVRDWVGAVAFFGGFLLALMGEGAILACIPVPSFVCGIATGFILEVVFGKIDIAMQAKKQV